MRYELNDHEWAAIKPMLPNKPRGVPRVNDRRVLNGIFWILRSGAPWRDLPDNFGPYTTCLYVIETDFRGFSNPSSRRFLEKEFCLGQSRPRANLSETT
jgi:transposase